MASNFEVTHISFGWRQAELNETNLGLLHTSYATVGHLLGQNQTLHQLTVINGPSENDKQMTNNIRVTGIEVAAVLHSPEFLDDLDVLQVHACGGGRVDDAHDRINAHGSQQAGVL